MVNFLALAFDLSDCSKLNQPPPPRPRAKQPMAEVTRKGHPVLSVPFVVPRIIATI